MIKGIGVDLVLISRMEKNVTKDRFLTRIFTQDELVQCNGFPARLAGNFAVKEAVAKAFGTGFRGFGPSDIECLRDEAGCPYVNLHGSARQIFEKRNATSVYVSITNEGEYVCAVAVIEG